MVFGCIKDKSGKDIQDQLKKQGCESLRLEPLTEALCDI